MISMIIMFALLLVTPGLQDNHDVPFLNTMESGDWELVKNDDGVQTYVRWTKTLEGKPVRERKGEMNVNCSVQDAVVLLTDAGSTGKWMSGISENYCLTRIDQSQWYTYTLFNIPWPFNKRDLVSLYKMDSDSARGIVNIVIISKEKYVPLKEGIDRLVNYRAIWVITRIGQKNVKISFNATSSATPVLPRPIQDPVLERIFHNNLVRLKKALSS